MNKSFRGLILLSIVLMVFAYPCIVSAQNDPSPSPTDAKQTTQSGTALKLDNKNRYEDMKKAYKDGYMPEIKTGRVAVYLPLISSEDITGNSVTVAPDFGDAASSPFVFTNVQKTVKLAEHAVGGGKKVSAYLVKFSFSLAKDRVNGRYPLSFNVKYTTAAGQGEQVFSIYVTITDGINPNATPKPESAPAPEGTEKPLPQPKLMVSNYSVSPDPVMAGAEFTINSTLKNTNTKQSVQNIKLSLKAEGDEIIPSETDSTQYIESIGKGDSKELTFTLKARQDAKPLPQKLSLAIEYEDSKTTALTSSADIVVEVKQPVKLEMDTPNIPSPLNAGDTIPVTMGVFNMGKGTVSNVLCELETPGLIPQGSVFLGNMESGASKTAEFSVFVGTKDMTAATDGAAVSNDAEKYGPTSGKIKITFEDEFGEQYSKEIEISTEINQPYIPETTPAVAEPEQPKASQWWISVLIVALIILAALAVLFILRKRKLKSEVNQDEDD